MARRVRNEDELNRAMLESLRPVVDYVVEQILKEHKEIVREVVYDAYSPVMYDRTFQFQNAWDIQKNSSVSGHKVTSVMSYDANKLTTNEAQMQHRVREALAEIIFEGLAGNFVDGYAKNDPRFAGQAWTEKRDAWKRLNQELTKTKLRQYFEEGMRREGIKFTRHRVGVDRSET